MRKNWRNLFGLFKGKTALPPAEESPLWEVRDRVRNILGEEKAAFRKWAVPRRRHGPFTELLKDIDPDIEQHVDSRDLEEVEPEDEGDIYFFDGVIQSLSHVTLPPGSRLAAKLASCWGDAQCVFYAAGNGCLLPLEHTLCLDGTPDAYWEAVVLWFECAQFYRFGHSNYEHMEMIADLRSFILGYSFCAFTGEKIFNDLAEGERQRLYQMKFRPEVIPTASGCQVLYTTFAPFSGFSRTCLTITKKDVGISILAQVVEHVSYRCSIMF